MKMQTTTRAKLPTNKYKGGCETRGKGAVKKMKMGGKVMGYKKGGKVKGYC